VERVASETPVGTQAPLDWVSLLADEVGPRRPTGKAERAAAELVRERLEDAGIPVRLESFRGYSTFAAPIGVILGLALAPALLPARRRRLRSLLALAAAAGLISEFGLVRTPLSTLLSRRPSQNVVAEIEPEEPPRRTVCLVCHLDASRSGLMFHPRAVHLLNPALQALSATCLAQATEPVLGGSRSGRRILGSVRTALALGGALLLERELRGEDVPGANDNASGVAVVARLGLEHVMKPLGHTRLVLLMTGCEESGLLGSQAFLRSHDTADWLFVNFDNIGGRATLRYVKREGVGRKWDADPALAGLAARIAAARPELGLAPSDAPIGLTYDVSPVLARGGRGITFVAGDNGVIPNYHWPTDTTENVDPDSLDRAIEVGREMLAAIDRGEADTPGAV
jgi:peptidase M28-like protein